MFTRAAAKVAGWGDRVQVAIGDFGHPESLGKAAAGVKGIFLMNGGDGEQFKNLLTAVKEQGRPRIVFLSTILAGPEELLIGRMHREKEDVIRRSGLEGRFLRPGAFMSNVLQWAGSIRAEGTVFNALGEGKFAPAAPEDIAAVAVEALLRYTDEVLELTGGELTTAPEQVTVLSEVLGKPIQCVDVPMETAVQGLLRAGLPEFIARAVAKSFEAIRHGKSDQTTDTVERVTGRKPIRFADWARSHAGRFA